ncbi:MAG: Rv1355c family protein [Flavobacteriales bacterium]|nr:Rv1355c family protein [Flavobacteriales bacterium]
MFDTLTYRPVHYNLRSGSDLIPYKELISRPGIQVSNHILPTLEELVKTRHPNIKFDSKKLQEYVEKELNGLTLDEYGTWVYYPWSNRLIHLPDEEAFIFLRTSRNLYKITPEEQKILRNKVIGVIGLSVGQSVATTLVIERICGEIRLADFDVLELTNLNRIRTGLHNLGLNKAILAAREIAEIDPFIKVKCFTKGVTEENLDAFLTEGGKLDLLIEESDGIDIKVLSRIRAKSLRIPVLMEASDKCMVDVERYDLNPDLGLLHGILGNLEMDTLRSLTTNEQKIPYMLDIAGIDTASQRIKASMLEIEQTINTWPQLASAVAMGGGITADVSRRILLNQYTESGRYHIDIEELIGNKGSLKNTEEKTEEYPFTDVMGILSHLQLLEIPSIDKPSESELKSMVSDAILAPSGGNYQPWAWVHKAGYIYLFNAIDANEVFLGFGNIASYVALGASLENLIISAGKFNYQTLVEYFPDPNNTDLIARIAFKRGFNPSLNFDKLSKGLRMRHTNRNLGPRKEIDASKYDELIALAKDLDGAKLEFITDPDKLNEAGDLLGELEKIRMLEKNGHRDFREEIRWTEEENLQKKDGLDIKTFDFSQTELAGLKIARQTEVMDLLRKWNGGNAFRKIVKKSIDSASAIGILSVKGQSGEDFVKGGQILEKIWIMANTMGIAFQPMSSSLFIYYRLLHGRGIGISEDGQARLKELIPLYQNILNVDLTRGNILIFRLALAREPEVRSLRRPIESCYFSV